MLVGLSDVIGQSFQKGLYSDSLGKNIIYVNDSIIGLRLKTQSAFTQYNLYWGSYKLKKHKLEILKNIATANTANVLVDSSESLNKIIIQISACEYPSIYISCLGKDKHITVLGNEIGYVELSEELLKPILGCKNEVEIIDLGFHNYYTTSLRLGFRYIFTSKVRRDMPFGFFRSQCNFNINNTNNSIEINAPNIYKITLYKVNERIMTLDEFLSY